MEDLPPLEVVLECIPAANRRLLDEKPNRKSRAIIAKSIRNWKTLAQYLPNIETDIEAIEYNNPHNLNLQRIDLLEKWLERNGPLATYRKLAKCLYEAGAIGTLQVLCKELGKNLLAAAASNVAPNSPPSTHQSLNPHYAGVQDMEPTSTLPETKETAANTVVVGYDERELNPSHQLSSPVTESQQVTNLEREIKGLHRRFNSIKELTINCLEKCRITVMTVVYLLTSILGVGEHKKFLEDKHKVLRKSEDHLELFGELNLYWNYLSFDLLDELIDELIEKNSEFKEIKKEMEKYKEEMKRFRKSTTLVLFCQAINPHVGAVLPPGFQKMVTKHQWPETVTLKDVEEFRKSFLLELQLPKCALMVYKIQRKCFEVTWFVALPAQLLVESGEMIKVFIEFKVVSVKIDGECVYQAQTQPLQPLSLPASGSIVTDVSPETHQEQDYESSLSDFSAASLSGFVDSERLRIMALYSGDEVVEILSTFIDTFFEGVQELLNYGEKAINGLQRLLDSIDSKVEGKKADEGIEGLKEKLREVLSKAEEYRNACFKAARRGSRRQEIDGINEALKQGDLDPSCDKYETRKKSAKIGGIVAGGAAGVCVVGGLAALVGGAILNPFFPPAGLLIAGAGGAVAAVGGIGGTAATVTAIVVKEIAKDALVEVESLGNHLESVKRRVHSINATMDECEDKIKATNRSGKRVQGRERVSRAVCIKIQKSLDTMCTKFEILTKTLI